MEKTIRRTRMGTWIGSSAWKRRRADWKKKRQKRSNNEPVEAPDG